MKHIISTKTALAISVIVGAVLLATAIFLAAGEPKKLATPVAAPTASKASVPPAESFRGLPMRLLIPAINVDTAIEYVGDTPKGDMAVPAEVNNVAWYKYGVLPGEIGSSVIAGHVVGPKGKPAIFIDLNKLQKGDVVEVIDAKGQVASFIVRDKKSYARDEKPAEVFNSSSGSHLNLITCAGDWDAAQRQYESRLVVFTDKADSDKVSQL